MQKSYLWGLGNRNVELSEQDEQEVHTELEGYWKQRKKAGVAENSEPGGGWRQMRVWRV